MSTSECLGTSVMSRYGRIRSRNDLTDQNFCRTKITVTGQTLVPGNEVPRAETWP